MNEMKGCEMTHDTLLALRAKVTELAQRYRLQHASVYVSSSGLSVFQNSPLVGAYGLEKNGGTIYAEGESFESVLRVLEHKLIAKRMSEGAK